MSRLKSQRNAIPFRKLNRSFKMWQIFLIEILIVRYPTYELAPAFNNNVDLKKEIWSIHWVNWSVLRIFQFLLNWVGIHLLFNIYRILDSICTYCIFIQMNYRCWQHSGEGGGVELGPKTSRHISLNLEYEEILE